MVRRLINYLLGQPYTPTSLGISLKSWDGRTIRMKIVITIVRDYGSAY